MRRRSPTPPPPDRVAALLRPRPRGASAPVGAAPAAGAAGIPLPSADAARPPRGPLRRRPRHRSPEAAPPPLLSLPGPLRHVRIRPAWGAVLGLALVGLVAAAILGVRAWGAASAAEPTAVPPPVRPGASASAAGGAGSGASGSGASGTASAGAAASGAAPPGGALRPSTASRDAPPSGTVVVHVVGQVRSPGVVRLPNGARVEDAVRAAGGAAGSAQLSALNLARVLVDGEQVVVPAPGDPVATGAAPGPAPGAAPRAPGGRIDLNTADVATLDTLPGVGPVTAQKIVEWRTAHGRFSSVDELAEVPGIGPKLLEQLAPLVRV